MSRTPSGPNRVKGALVSIDLDTDHRETLAFYYNPGQLRLTSQPHMIGGEGNDRSEEVEFTNAPIQHIKIDVEFDVTDLIDQGDTKTKESSVFPQLKALELLAYPNLDQIHQKQSDLNRGVVEKTKIVGPRLLFISDTKHVLPVHLNAYQITEEAFDKNLNPIRAIVQLELRVINSSDLD